MREVLGHCWGVVANETEAAEVTGLAGADAAAALAAMGPVLALVTLGSAGCVDATGRRHPAPPAEPVDTTGAGDAFCGVLAAGLAAGSLGCRRDRGGAARGGRGGDAPRRVVRWHVHC